MGIKVALRFLLTICFCFSICSADLKELSLEERSVLNKFFQVLIGESEVGYVLLDKKPVCIHGFFNKDPFLVNTTAHKHSVALREGARIWQRYANADSNVIIHISEQEDPLISNWIHVIAINRSLFREVLENNIALFQYVLGPVVNPDNLLMAFTSDKLAYHSLLRGDKVLIGEVLGFGTQNALYVSRIENIEERLDQDSPPFLKIQDLIREYPDEHLPFEPGFGFQSITQELLTLQDDLSFPSEKLTQSSPEFIFG
jgi:hypothetical protein